MEEKLSSYLVDTDVLRNGRMSTHVWESKPLRFWERRLRWGRLVNERVGYSSLRPKAIREDERHRRESRAHIAAIAKAAYEKKLTLFTSSELSGEQWRQKIGRAGLDVDVFQIVDFEVAPSPIERSYAFTYRPWDKEKVSDRSKREQWAFFESIQEPRYLQLRKHIGDKHLGDIYHYWTAEVQRLDGFLTVDKTFRNAFYKQAQHFAPECSVLSPADVCELNGLPPVDIDDNIRTKLSGMGAFVHAPVLAYAALGLD